MPRQSETEQRMRERLARHKHEKETAASYSTKAASVPGHAPIGMERSVVVGAQPDRSRSALGFEYTALLAGRQAEYIRSTLKYFAHRSARWKAAFPSIIPYQGGAVNTLLNLRKSAKLKRFCRKGIPTDLRPSVWMSISGASKKMHSSPGVYQDLVDKGNADFSQQILLDMHRTFPNNHHFRPDGCLRQQQLHRLLSAYATFNPDVGYCQGMNFVCGMLLLVLNGNEEETFWLFDAMVAKMPPHMYASDMLGIQAECATFFSIMKEDYPDLSAILARRGALEVMPAIVVKWLINAYVDTVPEETVLRVWDCLFSEDWKVLYRVGLAMLLRAHRSGELESHDAASVLEFLSNIGWSTFDANELFATAYDDIDAKGTVNRARINKLREQHRKNPS